MNSETEPFQRPLIALGAALAGLSVVLGALGSHALTGRIAPAALGWWQTAVQYLMWHSLAVLMLGLVGWKWVRLPALVLAAGALTFSGTLFFLALGAPRWIGAITPLGGIGMIVGWVLLAWRSSRH